MVLSFRIEPISVLCINKSKSQNTESFNIFQSENFTFALINLCKGIRIINTYLMIISCMKIFNRDTQNINNIIQVNRRKISDNK